MAADHVDLDQLSVDAIRTLAIDAVDAANSGHPGAPLALAPAAYVLYRKVMNHNPADPHWADRDRFVLSAGHASALLYSTLHLSGYDLPLDEIKNFRQLGSLTPGHPEVHHTAGVETTTGPLGAGISNAVGMAMAERWLRETYGTEVCDHFIFGICSDGDLMEGVSAEAASLAGHLGLGKLVFLYDDNRITIDGTTDLAFSTEDVEARFRAYGWHTLAVEDGNDLAAIEAAVRAGMAETSRPTLIRLRTIIGYPSPNKQNTSGVHGSPLGADETRLTKEALGWDPDKSFYVPDEVYAHFRDHVLQAGAAAQSAWNAKFDTWAAAHPELAQQWKDGLTGTIRPGLREALPVFDPETTPKMSSRVAGGKVMQAVAKHIPSFVGGAADLAHSTMTFIDGDPGYTREHVGRDIYFGIREHGMGSAVNGIALHGGLIKPYGSTFFVFADYMRPSLRLSALMNIGVVWVFTHDSVAVGEDGPTHEPVEHLASLRAIPNLTVIRPGDANETAEAWRTALEDVEGPAVLVLSRQDLPTIDRGVYAPASGLAKGAYTLAAASNPAAVIVATGSEVSVALAAREQLAAKGVEVSVVSMPSWELFEKQSQAYRDEVLPAGVPKVSVEAGASFGWARWVDRSVSIDTFGASGPGAKVLAQLGITPENVVANVEAAVAAS